MAEIFTAFITKHALTVGIITRLVTLSPCNENMAKASDTNEHYHKDEWFLSLPEAQANAEKRRDRKHKSLEKQINKLESLDYSKPTNLDHSKPTNLVGNIKAQDRPPQCISKPRTAVYDMNR